MKKLTLILVVMLLVEGAFASAVNRIYYNYTSNSWKTETVGFETYTALAADGVNDLFFFGSQFSSSSHLPWLLPGERGPPLEKTNIFNFKLQP
jgi:hypothetical protein